MGSLAVSPTVSAPIHHHHRPYTMLSAGLNQTSSSTTNTNNNSSSTSSSEPLFRAPSRPASQVESATQSSTASSNQASSTSIASSTPPRYPPSQHASSYSSASYDPHCPMTSHSSSSTHRLSDRQRPPFHRHNSSQSQQNYSSVPRRGSEQLPAGLPRQTAQSSPSSPNLQQSHRSSRSLAGSEGASPRIKVRDLSHIESFASQEIFSSTAEGTTHNGFFHGGGRRYEISSMPVTDVIEMVAGLLTKITSANDEQHDHIHRHIPPPEGATNLSLQTTSVLAFHGKNVPSITILNYLTRIHKYCPTTYEVFISILVYFDRMTAMVNREYILNLQRRTGLAHTLSPSPPLTVTGRRPPVVPPIPSGGNTAFSRSRHHLTSTIIPSGQRPPSRRNSIPDDNDANECDDDDDDDDSLDFSHYFVVDSYNIHRLVIAGVTCASKFFSDVFYTNSRYAKVGGLPLVELNHLELQFLLLNDFRLAVPIEELEAYGTMLVEFYAREVLIQRGELPPQSQNPPQMPSDGFVRPTTVRSLSERTM